jgi:hypothetical protein
MEPQLSNKQKFKKYPYLDPVSNKTIVIGSKEYKQLVKKYGEPHKVKSPTTQHLIAVNKTN